MKIPNSELQFTFSRSSGAGGQNINKVNTKVTMTWEIENTKAITSFVKTRFKDKFSSYINLEGVVKIVSQRYRNQPRNISDCVEKLHAMLAEVAKAPKRRIDTKPTRNSVKRRITSKKNKGDIKKGRKKVDY